MSTTRYLEHVARTGTLHVSPATGERYAWRIPVTVHEERVGWGRTHFLVSPLGTVQGPRVWCDAERVTLDPENDPHSESHAPDCALRFHSASPCSCGLSDRIAEAEEQEQRP